MVLTCILDLTDCVEDAGTAGTMANLYVWVDKHQERALNKRVWDLHRRADYFPDLQDGEDGVRHLVHELFPDNQPVRVHASNISLTSGEQIRTTLALRPVIDPLGERRFPKGKSLALTGSWDRRVPQPIFLISGIAEISDCPTRDFERVLDPFVYHQDPQGGFRRADNVLNSEEVSSLPLISQDTQRRLKDWDGFIAWKRNLVHASAVGLRYVACGWHDDTHLGFDVVAPDEATLRQTVRRLSRDDLRAFVLEASDDPLNFKPSDAPRPARLRDVRLGRSAGGIDAAVKPWSGEQAQAGWVVARWLVDPEDDVLNRLGGTDDADAVRKRVLEKIPPEGFVALSMAGDLKLLERHQRSLRKLAEQGGQSPYLSAYLFDVKRAHTPDALVPVDLWHASALNDPQREAVRKMLSAPDLCLLQGPPGTGKTTVIAEAVLQMAARGQTVLLASQAHSAVDNALGRLGDSTAVRAIRLGREEKVTDEGREFFGSGSLRRHYHALAAHSKRILDGWEKRDAECQSLSAWCDRAEFALADQQRILGRLQTQRQGLARLERDRQEAWKALQDAAQQREDQDIRRRGLLKLRDALVATASPDLSGPLPREVAQESEALAQGILALAYRAVRLKASAAEWKSHAERSKVMALLLGSLTEVGLDARTLEDDASRLRDRPQGLHEDPAIRLQIEQLDHKIGEYEHLMEVEPDEPAHGLAWREARSERRRLKDAPTSLFHEDACIRLFGEIIRGRWLQCSGDVANLVRHMGEALEPISACLAAAHTAKARLLAKTEALLAEDAVLSAVDEGPWREATARVERESAAISRSEAALSDKVAEGRQLLDGRPALARATGRSEDLSQAPTVVLERAIQQARANLAEVQAEVDGLSAHRAVWQGVLTDWVRDLQEEDAAEADWKLLGADWPGMCNVVAITCTEREETLDDAQHAQFDAVIVDEVSKATPLELLLPLMRARRGVLVGDHRQLPPLFQENQEAITMQDAADEAQEEDPQGGAATALTKENLMRYERMVTASLFKEHFEAADDSIRGRLSVQFRMHPQIMSLVNRFYEGTLTCGLDDPDRQRAHPFVLSDVNGNPMLGADDHVLWIDTSRGLDGQPCREDEDAQGRPLRTNLLEVRLIAHLLTELDRQAQAAGYSRGRRMSVGVVSFYAAQLRAIRAELKRAAPGQWPALDVDVNTVIRYQGREKDVVLVSMVRNDGRVDVPGGVKRRRSSRANVARFEFINVALSRARNLLFVLGARSMFESYEVDLPHMDRPGSTTRPVYRDMFAQLERDARLVDARKVMAPEGLRPRGQNAPRRPHPRHGGPR